MTSDSPSRTYRTSLGGYFLLVFFLIVFSAIFGANYYFVSRHAPDFWLVLPFWGAWVVFILASIRDRVILSEDALTFRSLFRNQRMPYARIARVELYTAFSQTEVIISLDSGDWASFESSQLQDEDELLRRLREALPDAGFAPATGSGVARWVEENRRHFFWPAAGAWLLSVFFVEPTLAFTGILVGIAFLIYRTHFHSRLKTRSRNLSWWVQAGFFFILYMLGGSNTRSGNWSWEVLAVWSGFVAILSFPFVLAGRGKQPHGAETDRATDNPPPRFPI